MYLFLFIIEDGVFKFIIAIKLQIQFCSFKLSKLNKCYIQIKYILFYFILFYNMNHVYNYLLNHNIISYFYLQCFEVI